MSERLLSADKIKQHVLDNWVMERHAGTDASGIRAEVWAELNDSLRSDMFDITTEPRPNFIVTFYKCWNLILTNSGLHEIKEYLCRPSDEDLEHVRQILGAERYELEEIKADGN